MTYGVVAELQELIELRRYAQLVRYPLVRKNLRNGSNQSCLRGRGMDFAEVRNYQAGDEIRHMEWRVTARTGKPHVKLYHEEREIPVVILTDFNPSMVFGTKVAFKSVIAARLASIIAWTVAMQGDKIGGFLFSATKHHELVPRGRDAGVLPLLAALSRYTRESLTNREAQPRTLSDALIRLRRVIRPGSILVIISDFYSMDKECEKHLNRLMGHHDILAYHICDPLELAPPKPQSYAITDGQDALIWDTRIKSVSHAYQDYCLQHVTQLKEQCHRLQVQYVPILTDADLAQSVRETFPWRKRG